MHRQGELLALEKELKEIDAQDAADVRTNTRVRSLRSDKKQDSKRTDLVDEIDRKLDHY